MTRPKFLFLFKAKYIYICSKIYKGQAEIGLHDLPHAACPLIFMHIGDRQENSYLRKIR